jgi:putative molybdopterin biosynthesis protein
MMRRSVKPVTLLKSIEQIKILSDPRRLSILRCLMAGPATLTQLGQTMGKHPAWIRHHLKQLEQVGLVELASVQVSGGVVEKFYQATARLFLFQETILPDLPDQNTLILLGSHDLALSQLTESKLERAGFELLLLPVGSLDGLIALRQGLAHLTACHLLDFDTGEYNLSYVRRLFPGRPMKLITLAHREQGLMLARGNPLQVTGLEDLVRGDVTFVNRNAGSGTRLWLDKRLHELGLLPSQIAGYGEEVRTHSAVASAIAEGKAGAGLGLVAAARRFDLEIIPLFQERFDLVIPLESPRENSLIAMLDHINSSAFRQMAESLGGYSTFHTGEVLMT